MTWMEAHDVYPSALAVLAALLCVSEAWAAKIQARRLAELNGDEPIHRQLVSFLADFHRALATAAALLCGLCFVLIVTPEDAHTRYLLWSAWVLAWLGFSVRRWRWLVVGSRVRP